MKVTEISTLAEILEGGGESTLKANNVPCMTCPLAAQEINKLTIGQVSKIYGLDGGKIVSELNR